MTGEDIIQRSRPVFLRVIEPDRDNKNPQDVSRCGGSGSYGRGLQKINVFLKAPSYKKTPHGCKGLRGCFERGFFEGS